MKTVKELQVKLNLSRENYNSLLAQHTIGIATTNIVKNGEATTICRSLINFADFDFKLKAVLTSPQDLEEYIEAASYCDGSCDGCVENDGSGCDAVIYFHNFC
jgi:hypothetical protein